MIVSSGARAAASRESSAPMPFVDAASKLHALCNAIDGAKLECAELSVLPHVDSVEVCTDNTVALAERIGALELSTIDAFRTAHAPSTTTNLIENLGRRRSRMAVWYLPDCPESRPEMMQIASHGQFLTQLQAVHSWCARTIGDALSPRRDIIRKLVEANVRSARAQRKGESAREIKTAREDQISAINLASKFLFEKVLPASEVAVEHGNFLRQVAQDRPFANQITPDLYSFAQELTDELRSSLRISGADEKLLAGVEVIADPEEIRKRMRESAQASPIFDADRSSSSENEAEAPRPISPGSQSNANVVVSRSRRERRETRATAKATKPTHQLKFDRLRANRTEDNRKQALLAAIAETDLKDERKRGATLEFYRRYSDMRLDAGSGWKAHVKLLSDPDYQFPELAQMRKVVEGDIREIFARSNHDVEVRCLPAASDGLNGELIAFLKNFRSNRTPEINTKYFQYATEQLCRIAEEVRTSPLSKPQKKRILLRPDIESTTRRQSVQNPAHPQIDDDDDFFVILDKPIDCPMQPEIRLADDKRSVELSDTIVYDERLGEKTYQMSFARAADMLSSSAIGSTRVERLNGRGSAQRTTPESAAWLHSVAVLAPNLDAQNTRLLPYDGKAYVASTETSA